MSLLWIVRPVFRGNVGRKLREETSRMVGSLIDFPFPEICEAWGNPDLVDIPLSS